MVIRGVPTGDTQRAQMCAVSPVVVRRDCHLCRWNSSQRKPLFSVHPAC